jgi:type II secretory pathway predicted ATPase ExeA
VRTTGLTYEPFYGLKEKPFSLTSDARFFYQSRSHAPAFDNLLHAIKRRESLTVLTGDIGTGKTTLCRAALQSLDRKTFSAFVSDPFASREDLLKVLLTDFGVASVEDLTSGRLHDASRTELSYLLYEFLGTLAPLQAFAVVLIDEAQNLSLPLLEEIRILSDADGQLQVILVGQLEFREKLRLPQMRQLDQRVSVHCRLEPLDVAGVAGYVSHRLHRAGGSADRIMFSGDAVETVYALSGGVPRVINKLCDRALHLGHTRRVSTIDTEIVTTANSDTVAPRPEPTIAPVSVIDIAAPLPAVTAAASAVVVPAADPPPSPAEPLPGRSIVQSAPLPATPPAPSKPERGVERGLDSVDTWLAGIEDKATAAAKAKKTPVKELPDPNGWRERWAPNDAIRPIEQDRRSRFRIRFGPGLQATQRASAQSSPGFRQFVVAFLTMIVLVLVAFTGPWIVRTSVRVARYVNAQFSAPAPPEVAAPSRTRIPLPHAPRVPDGPY